MIEKTLKSGTAVKIKELTLDKIAELEDIQYFEYDNSVSPPKPIALRNQNKAHLAWLRAGVVECGGWIANGIATVPDKVLKELTEADRTELVAVIQAAQTLDEKKV